MSSDFVKMGGTYHCEGDYRLPDLVAPDVPALGIWGLRRRRFLCKHRYAIYTGMLLGGTLGAHLMEVDIRSEQMMQTLMRQFAVAEGVDEALKGSDQIEWTRRMNSIRNQAEEIVYKEMITV